MSNFIKIENITKKYEKNKTIKVLNDVSFNFESGKIYSIVGPSGSGKSTLLNLLSLIDTPNSGVIKINDNSIDFENKIDNDNIRAKKIGIIYQDKNLLSDFSAIENVYLPNLLLSNDHTISIKNARSRIAEIVKKDDYKDKSKVVLNKMGSRKRTKISKNSNPQLQLL